MRGTSRPPTTEKCQAENFTSSTATPPRSRPRRASSSNTSSISAPTKGPERSALVGREWIARRDLVGEVRQAEALHASVSDVRHERMSRRERLLLRKHGARVQENIEEFRARRSGEDVDDLLLGQHVEKAAEVCADAGVDEPDLRLLVHGDRAVVVECDRIPRRVYARR